MIDLASSPPKRIWWLASYPKSGSTWVRQFLNCYVTHWPARLNSPWQYVVGDHSPVFWKSTLNLDLSDLTSDEMPLFRPGVLANALRMTPSIDLTLKTHHANVRLDDVPLCPPQLTKGAVLIVRDPRAVAVSFADHMGIEIDQAIAKMADNGTTIHAPESPGLEHILMSWSSHTDSWTVQNKTIRTTVVRYEDLLADPFAGFRSVLVGFGIEIDEEALAYAIDQTQFAVLQAQEQKTGFREASNKARSGFFRRGLANAWRRRGPGPPAALAQEEIGGLDLLEDYGIAEAAQEYLTDAQRRRIEAHHGETMKRLDYALEETPNGG